MEYEKLVELYKQLEGTTKRLEKTFLISRFLRNVSDEDLNSCVLLIQGRVFPHWDQREIGLSSKLLIKALSKTTSIDSNRIEKLWAEIGDLGEVAYKILSKKRQMSLFTNRLTVNKVHETFVKISSIEGEGSLDLKVNSLMNLFLSASPEEAKYIARTVTEDLRIGVGDGILRDAIAWAFLPKVIGSIKDAGCFVKCPFCNEIVPSNDYCVNCKRTLPISTSFVPKENFIKIESLNEFYEKINEIKDQFIITPEKKEISNVIIEILQEAFDILNDFYEVCKISKHESLKGLVNVKLIPLRPIKVMLYLKAEDLRDALTQLKPPVAVEYKYDGFRMQIHKYNGKIKLYTRRLEDVTKQFPDVVDYVKQFVNASSFIIDSEVVGYDKTTFKYLPFQKISQRIKRKYDIEVMAKELPVEVNAFDLLYLNGQDLIKEPFKKRRALLEKIIEQKRGKIVVAKQRIVNNIEEANEFYQESLQKGNEGIMVKSLEARYKPGKRVGYGLKVKPTMETLDLVIVGAEWGEGKRGGWLTSYIIACKDGDNLLEIGKVGSGFKELDETGLTFSYMTDLLKPLIIEEKGKVVRVKPKIILEVAYEEIQKSPTYSSGFALRFPRVIRIRDDKSVDEISTLEHIKQLYLTQRHRNE